MYVWGHESFPFKPLNNSIRTRLLILFRDHSPQKMGKDIVNEWVVAEGGWVKRTGKQPLNPRVGYLLPPNHANHENRFTGESQESKVLVQSWSS